MQTVEGEVGAGHRYLLVGSVENEAVVGVDVRCAPFLLVLGEWENARFGGDMLELSLDDGVVLPEYECVIAGKVLQNAELGVDVVLELIVVAVEVVGRDVHYHGYVGMEAVHVFELEGAKLDYIDVMLVVGYLQCEALSHVARQAHVDAGVLEYMVGEQGSGGLAV